MARFVRTSVPRFDGRTATKTITQDGSRNQIAAPDSTETPDNQTAAPTAVFFSTTSGFHYIGVDTTADEGIILGSGGGDVSHIYIELGPNWVLYTNGENAEKLEGVWFYD